MRKLDNIRISKNGNIVADHKYAETHPGGMGRKVNATKIIATPNEDGSYSWASSSERGRAIAIDFAKKNNLVIH